MLRLEIPILLRLEIYEFKQFKSYYYLQSYILRRNVIIFPLDRKPLANRTSKTLFTATALNVRCGYLTTPGRVCLYVMM